MALGTNAIKDSTFKETANLLFRLFRTFRVLDLDCKSAPIEIQTTATDFEDASCIEFMVPTGGVAFQKGRHF
jgi:hypothetical protein